jgi:ABC-2 type transport system ATP-binding protein
MTKISTTQNNTTTSDQLFIHAQKVSKQYGSKTVLQDVDLKLGAGEIVGLIGPNGAGKSTLLKAIMGLIRYSGDLAIFGQNPFKNRSTLLENMSYIADVASLPNWMKAKDLLSFVADTHPKFDIEQAKSLLKDTPIELKQSISELSKGMKTRLHLAVILAIDTDLLVLDEPTLGLDVLVRRDFQDRLVEDYYNQQRSILITTHQIDEVENILTRVVFIKEGQITLDLNIADLKSRYFKLVADKSFSLNADLPQPIYQRSLPEKSEFIFEGADLKIVDTLRDFGEISTPSLEDLFVATNS